ncbi:hypothetical protein [Sphingomonas humi]|uniref:Uncharacterized protein n=1 Tax=Sphingomonas humi TaxID=335630 RepID=A0ABP7RH71_9SPHN
MTGAEFQQRDAFQAALRLISEAVDLLDGHGGPPEVAVHLELAAHGLQQAIGALSQHTS